MPYQDKYIETIKNEYYDSIWLKYLKACEDYQLLKPNDHICVCISGGKDSMLLAKLFQMLENQNDKNIKITYLVMNPGYNSVNLDLIKNNLKKLNIDAKIVDTDIFEIANNQEKNPCYLCAKMRRGALYNIAKKLECNKIALGHHYDDVIETTLMNLLNSGSFQTMLPKLHSTNFEGMELIRPLYYVKEETIISWKDYNNLEFIRCACKLTENIERYATESGSQRYATKMLIKELKQKYPEIESNIFNSASNINIDKVLATKKGNEVKTFLDNYKKRL